MQGPTGPAGAPPAQAPKAEAADGDLRRQGRDDRFGAGGRETGGELPGRREARPRSGGAALEARGAALAGLVAARAAGADSAEAAPARRVLAERPAREEGAEARLLPAAGGVAPSSAPAAKPAAAPPEAPLPRAAAERVERIAALAATRIAAFGPGPAPAGVAISLALDPAEHGLAGLQVTQLGQGPAARIEVVLSGAVGELAANLAAAAQQLADRLQARFPLRAVTLIAEDGAAEAEASGQAALSALFAPRGPVGGGGA